jgi:hypothetical protein
MAKHKYIFPNFLAEFMSKVDMRTQYEASMMSMTLIMIGLIVSGFYLWIYTSFALWYKIFLVINALAGVVFLSSFVITTYQQYITYMKALEFQKQMKGGNENAKENNI